MRVPNTAWPDGNYVISAKFALTACKRTERKGLQWSAKGGGLADAKVQVDALFAIEHNGAQGDYRTRNEQVRGSIPLPGSIDSL